MAITRYESLAVNRVVTTKSAMGQQSSAVVPWFNTRGLVHDVTNSLRISEKYRVYNNLVNITLNYTPNTKEMTDNQNLYSISWRGFDWRITDCREHNDRMKVTFICYRNDPAVPV